ncbi:MFS transporter [Herbaspirillum sp. 3R-3a1]
MNPSNQVAGRISVAARIERLPLTKYQRLIFMVIATAWLFDSIDLAIMTFMLGSIKTDLGLTAAQAGLLASSSFLGMLVGALIAGIAADRIGRKPVFQVSMILWGAGSLACAFAPDVNYLMLFRVLLGIGMGMEFPVGLSILSEFLPTKGRGKYIAILEGFWPIGFILAGTAAYLFLPIVGWRGIFLLLAVPSVFVFIFRQMVPESARWLESRGRIVEADQVVSHIEEKVKECLNGQELPPVDPVFAASKSTSSKSKISALWENGYAKRTFMTLCLWFFALLGYYGLTTWLGALLQNAGYEVTKSVFYTIIISFAGIPGFMVAAWLVEVWGRKPTCILMLLGSASCAYIYGQTASVQAPVAQLIAAGLSMQFFFFGMWSVLYAYTPELFPTQIRATGAGLASAVGRVGSLIGPSVIGVILPAVGQGGVFALGAVSFLIAALVVLVLGVETKGRSLEEVSN